MSREGSRIPGFYRLSVAQRRALIGLEGEGGKALSGGLELDEADGMIENVVGTYSLPLGVALNFRINDRDYLVPMVIEEPSVVAAASNAARRVRAQGGFLAVADPPRSEEHTSELQSQSNLVCRLLLEKKKKQQ